MTNETILKHKKSPLFQKLCDIAGVECENVSFITIADPNDLIGKVSLGNRDDSENSLPNQSTR